MNCIIEECSDCGVIKTMPDTDSRICCACSGCDEDCCESYEQESVMFTRAQVYA